MNNEKLAQWYSQMAALLDTGLPLAESLEAANGPSLKDRMQMATQIHDGSDVYAVLRDAPAWLPKRDRPMLGAAAQTGRLPAMFRQLSGYREQLAKNIRRVITLLAYPLFVLHMGIMTGAIASQIQFDGGGFRFDVGQFLGDTIPPLVLLWAILITLFTLYRMESSWLQRLGWYLPGFRGWLRHRDLAEFARVLGAFLETGIDVPKAWAAAGLMVTDKRLQLASLAMQERINDGLRPGAYLEAHPVFPSEFRSLYQTGERTGSLDENLAKLAVLYGERASAAMTRTLTLYPTVLLIAVFVIILVTIFSVFSGYLEIFREM